MEYRELGRTGRKVSVVGFGGIIVMNETRETAARWVKMAVERGVTYFDVAPSYGNAQKRLGPALYPYRDKVFLACKTGKRTADEARAELELSLKELRTDHLDLYQFHAVTTPEDVKTITGPGGALETVLAAQKAGEIKHIGFSAHTTEGALGMMAVHDFDTVLFPVNWRVWHSCGMGPEVLAEAKKREMGILALKALADRPWRDGEDHQGFKSWYRPVGTKKNAELGLRFALGQGAAAAVSPGSANLLWWMCDIAADEIKDLSPSQKRSLKDKAAARPSIFPQQPRKTKKKSSTPKWGKPARFDLKRHKKKQGRRYVEVLTLDKKGMLCENASLTVTCGIAGVGMLLDADDKERLQIPCVIEKGRGGVMCLPKGGVSTLAVTAPGMRTRFIRIR